MTRTAVRTTRAGTGRVTTVVAMVAAVPAVAIVGLLLMVLQLAFREGGVPSGGWTTGNVRALTADPQVWRLVRDTATYVAVTVGVAMVLGVALAWLVERTDLGWRRTIHTAMVVRLLIPGFLTAMGWLFLAHPRIGVANGWLQDLFGLASGPLNPTSLVGMGVVEGLVLSSVVFILVAGSLRSMDGALEEAARANGVGAWAVFWRVTAPLAYPALAGAGLFVAMIALSSLDTPLVLGLGNNVLVFSTYLYLQTRPAAGVLDYGVPAAFSSLLIVLALGLAWWYTRVLGRSRSYQVVTGRGFRPHRLRLGRWRPVARAAVGGYFLVSTVLPVLMVGWISTQPYVQPPSLAALQLASGDHYRHLNWELVGRGAVTTGQLMLLAPTLTVVLSLGFAWLAVRSRLRWRRWYDAVAFLPHAVPNLIFAFGAALVALYWTRGWYDLYGSLLLLVLVVALVHLAFGTRLLNASLLQLHPELDEAAAMSGASPVTTLRRVVLPLLRPAVVHTWLWLALLSFRDLTIPTLVGPPDTLTLSVVVWVLYSNGGTGPAAAATMVMLALLVPLAGAFLWVNRDRRTGWGD